MSSWVMAKKLFNSSLIPSGRSLKAFHIITFTRLRLTTWKHFACSHRCHRSGGINTKTKWVNKRFRDCFNAAVVGEEPLSQGEWICLTSYTWTTNISHAYSPNHTVTPDSFINKGNKGKDNPAHNVCCQTAMECEKAERRGNTHLCTFPP